MNIWVISDEHHQHVKCVELTGRPYDYSGIIKSNIAKLVMPGDILINLGDFVMGNRDNINEFMKDRGYFKNWLTPGNHDTRDPQFYIDAGFDFVGEHFIYNVGTAKKPLHIVFSHKPVVPLPDGVRGCMHGHFHKGSSHRSFEYEESDYFKENRERYHLIEIESNLAPRLLSDIMTEWGLK